MSTMREMAREYRLAAVKLAMRIQEKQAAGANEQELRQLRVTLRDIREIQRTLDGYYDIPRPERITAVGWKSRGPSDDDH